jgi:hypothetical protein
MTYETPEYDDNGNIIGSHQVGGRSPLSEYMGENAKGPEDRPARRALRDPEAKAALATFRTLTLGDLEALPEPEWLVNGIIPADGLTTLYGAPGSTKSFCILDAALCIASGVPFHGHVVKVGTGVYCVGEGLRGLRWRIEAWKLAHPEADYDLLEKNLVIIPHAPRLLEPTEQVMLHNTCKEVAEDRGDLRLFIIDTWARSLTGGDENSAQDAGVAIDVCERVRAETGATPFIVHHSGADGLRERGSTALRGASDCTLHMHREETAGIVTLSQKKSKDSEPFTPMKFNLQQFGHSVVLRHLSANTGSVGYYQPQKTRADWAREAAENRNNPF